MNRYLPGCLLLVMASVWSSSTFAEQRAPLYDVAVPVVAQSDAERRRAAQEALLILLTRITGLASIPRTGEVQAALKTPERFYNQFIFSGDARNGELVLKITFSMRPVLDLVNEAGLPVWWSRRPSVIAWISVDGSTRQILSGSSSHPLLEAVMERATLRGIPVEAPLMDLDDSLMVTPSDVWSGASTTLEAASARYGADLVLTGRATERFSIDQGAQLEGEWEVWIDGEPLTAAFSSATYEQAAVSGIDMIVDNLFDKYAVLSRDLNVHRFGVTGLDRASSYASVMRYLQDLEFINRVDVRHIDAKAITFEVVSRADRAQLLMLLTHDGTLMEDTFHRGLDVRLVWRSDRPR